MSWLSSFIGGNPIGAVLGVAGSLLGASQANKAANKQADAIKSAAQTERDAQLELAKPYTQAASFALPKFREMLMSQIAPTIGKENPYLTSAHELNTGNILRQKQGVLEASKRYWGASGNVGRARGEELRIGQAATEASNDENLSYGKSQQEYKDTNTNRMLTGLSTLAGLGQTGLSTASNAISTAGAGEVAAANIRGNAKQTFWEGMGTLAGIPVNEYLNDQAWQRNMALVKGSNTAGDAGASSSGTTIKKKSVKSVLGTYPSFTGMYNWKTAG